MHHTCQICFSFSSISQTRRIHCTYYLISSYCIRRAVHALINILVLKYFKVFLVATFLSMFPANSNSDHWEGDNVCLLGKRQLQPGIYMYVYSNYSLNDMYTYMYWTANWGNRMLPTTLFFSRTIKIHWCIGSTISNSYASCVWWRWLCAHLLPLALAFGPSSMSLMRPAVEFDQQLHDVSHGIWSAVAGWNSLWTTLQGINISHLGKRIIIFKMPFLVDMLVPWRVYPCKLLRVVRMMKSFFEQTSRHHFLYFTSYWMLWELGVGHHPVPFTQPGKFQYDIYICILHVEVLLK